MSLNCLSKLGPALIMALGINGCNSAIVRDNPAIVIHQEQALIHSLKAFVLARYDASINNSKENQLNVAITRQSLESRLAENSIPATELELLEGIRTPETLEGYLSSQGYFLLAAPYPTRPTEFNCMLYEVESVQEEEKILWGETFRFTKRILGHQIIPGFMSYNLEQQGVDSIYSGMIELGHDDSVAVARESIRERAREIYRKIAELKPDFDMQLSSDRPLSRFFGSGIDDEFFRYLSRLMVYKRLKDLLPVSYIDSENHFIDALLPLLENSTDFHEIQHLQDGKPIGVYSRNTYDRHLEVRARLSQIYHADPVIGLAAQLRNLAPDVRDTGVELYGYSSLIVNELCKELLEHREDFRSLDFEDYDNTGDAESLIKEFIRLMPDEIRAITKSIFDRLYRGRSLNEHCADIESSFRSAREHLAVREYEHALRDIEHILELDPVHGSALELAFNLYQSQDRIEEGIVWFRQYNKKNPFSPIARMFHARLYEEHVNHLAERNQYQLLAECLGEMLLSGYFKPDDICKTLHQLYDEYIPVTVNLAHGTTGLEKKEGVLRILSDVFWKRYVAANEANEPADEIKGIMDFAYSIQYSCLADIVNGIRNRTAPGEIMPTETTLQRYDEGNRSRVFRPLHELWRRAVPRLRVINE